MTETFIYETMLSDVSLCDELINYHTNNLEYKARGQTGSGVSNTKISTDVYVHAGVQNPIIFMYVKELFDAVNKYFNKYNLSDMLTVTIKESWNIQHYKPNEGFFGWHCERSAYQSDQRALVFMTYLNDVNDGGETEFFHQKLKVKPVKGKTVLWPTDFTHLHRGVTSPTQEKYIATGWFNFLDAIDVSKVNMDRVKS